MNTVSSSSSYSVKASSNRGMSGMVSGLDTEGMVEKMLSGTQSKIDKQNAEKQQIQWKQEIYRDIISDINAFHLKYFSFSSDTNLMSSAFFNAMSAVSSSSAVTVSANSAAPAGTTTVQVDRLATSAALKSGAAVSGNLTGTLDAAQLNKTVVLQVDNGAAVEINLNGVESVDDIVTRLGNAGISTSVSGGKLTLSFGEKSVKVLKGSTDLGLRTLGLTSKMIGQEISKDNSSLSTTIDLKATTSIEVSLDGISKTIVLDPEELLTGNVVDQNKLVETLQKGVHASIQVQVDGDKIGFSMKPKDGKTPEGHQIIVGGKADALAAIGMQNGQSDKLSSGMKLKDMNLNVALQGDYFKFRINGKEIEVSGDDTLSTLLSKINNSDAGVRISYLALEDKFSMVASDSGADFSIEVEQSAGNLLNALFGGSINSDQLETGSAVYSRVLATNRIEGTAASVATFNTGATFKINVDGKEYTMTLESGGDAEQVRTEINNFLSAQFGSSKGDPSKAAIELDANGQLIVRDHALVSFVAAGKSDTAEQNIALAFGLSGKNNRATEDSTWADVGLTAPSGNGSDKIADTAGLKIVDGRIEWTGSGQNQTLGGLTKDLFGTDTVDLSIADDDATATAQLTAGTNAKVTINGVETERSSNNFTVDGLTINLNKASTGETITIDTTRNTSQILDGIKAFINDYNTLIEKLNGLVDQEATYRDYAPLTKEQKKEMSEKEIELWEEKAKEGLLRRDSTISSFLSSMRSLLYQKPEGAKYALYDLGIETSSNWEDKGKLVLSADGENTLKKVLESESDEVYKLFNDPQSGIMVKMNDVIKATANTSSGSPGTLVTLAGVKGRASDKNNVLSERLKKIEEKIKSLQTSYEKEKNRYWNQFNAMETMISNMSSQSAWLSQMFA